LTTIRGNVDLMRRMGLGDPESLDAIQSETERLSRLAGDLLTLAQAESGELPLVLQVVELDTILLSVYRDARILAGTKVSVKLGEEDQAIVQGDPGSTEANFTQPDYKRD
jgi:signal transduction histidine kinase